MGLDWTYWPSDPYWTGDDYWASLEWRAPWIRPIRPVSRRWAAQRTVEPTVEPLDLATVKGHLKVDVTDDDTYISGLIDSATDFVERTTGLALLGQTWQLYVDTWPLQYRVEYWPAKAWPPGSILLPRYPIQSVTNFTWTDASGTANTVDPSLYSLDTVSRPPRVVPTGNWPGGESLAPDNAIMVEFTAGYGNVTTLPKGIRQALLMIIGYWYENREAAVANVGQSVAVELPMAARELLAAYTPPLVG